MVQTRFSEKVEREKQTEDTVETKKTETKPEAKKRGRKPNDGLPVENGSKKVTKTILMEQSLVNDISKLAVDDGRAFSNYVNMILLREVKKAKEDGRL